MASCNHANASMSSDGKRIVCNDCGTVVWSG